MMLKLKVLDLSNIQKMVFISQAIDKLIKCARNYNQLIIVLGLISDAFSFSRSKFFWEEFNLFLTFQRSKGSTYLLKSFLKPKSSGGHKIFQMCPKEFDLVQNRFGPIEQEFSLDFFLNPVHTFVSFRLKFAWKIQILIMF